MEPELTIHQCNPSQIVNLKKFIFGTISIAAIIALAIITQTSQLYFLIILPVLYIFLNWLTVKCTRFTLTDQRLIVSKGMFNKTTNETELYRVRDTSIEEPIFFRMFGVGNIIIYSTDEVEGRLHFNAYKKPHWIKDQIRNNAEVCRQKKRWGSDNILIHDLNQ